LQAGAALGRSARADLLEQLCGAMLVLGDASAVLVEHTEVVATTRLLAIAG
jgi:hypothetical protein